MPAKDLLSVTQIWKMLLLLKCSSGTPVDFLVHPHHCIFSQTQQKTGIKQKDGCDLSWDLIDCGLKWKAKKKGWNQRVIVSRYYKPPANCTYSVCALTPSSLIPWMTTFQLVANGQYLQCFPSEVNQHMVIQHVEHLEAQIFLKDIYCGK